MRRKKPKEHVNHERWLVSYADFITLLFAFFVVLFSSSQVDKRKVGRLALAIQVAFEHMGVFESSNSKMPLSTTEPMPFDNVQIVEQVLKTTDLSQPVPSSKGRLGEPGLGRGATRLMSTLQHEFDAEIKRNEISIRTGHEGIIITLREIGFFGSGSADVELKSEPTVARIAKLLRSQGYSIRIEGHTDNIPIHNKQFSSNWQLSTARAVGMTALFISNYGFPPDQISASGYAEFHPIASNLTPEGRFQNRRVDIVILTGESSPSFQADSPHEQSDTTHASLHPVVAPGS